MIQIVLLIFILIVVLLVVNHYKEPFNVNKIQFLENNSVCKILKKINYKYNTLDIKLRNIPFEYHGNLYKYYCDHLLDFNSLDKKLLIWVIEGMKQRTPDHLLFIFNTMKFAKFKNNIENGYPHTNYDIVFITEKFIYNLLSYYNNNNIEDAIKDIGSIIIHEFIHVWQRKAPEKFNDLYTYYWNFVKVDKIYNNKYLESIKRYNPDGVDTNWVFNFKGKHIYILSVYSEDAKHIGNVNFIAIYLEKSGNKYIIPKNAKKHDLLSVKEYNSFFTHLYGNHYHPNEISAELLSIHYLKQMNISHEDYSNMGYKNMVVWLNKTLKN